jgi:hypothetical protein
MADRAYRRSTRYPELFSPAGSSKWWAFVPNPDGGKALRIRTGHTDELAAHRFYLDHVRGERAQPVELPQERRENEIGLERLSQSTSKMSPPADEAKERSTTTTRRVSRSSRTSGKTFPSAA